MKNTDEALAELIRKGIEAAEKTGKFVIDQAPELLQQFYTWHIVQNVFGILLGILILLGIYKLVTKTGKKKEDWEYDVNVFGKWITFPAAMFGSFLLVIGIIFFLKSIYDLLFILTAPKLYLIEYFIK